jgi:hypothetical protein
LIGHLIYGGILGGVTGRAAGDAQAVSWNAAPPEPLSAGRPHGVAGSL